MNNKNSSVKRMTNRLGWDLGANHPQGNPNVGLEGMDNMSDVLVKNGGYGQQERMIFDKRRTFDRVLRSSYQAATIRRVQSLEPIESSSSSRVYDSNPHKYCKALINPDKNKMDYDDKIVSIHNEENYHSGDIFEWVGTNTFWLIHLQELTELAYFRAEIRRCNYEIKWEDEMGIRHSTYAAVRGPVETKIDYIQKHGISIDNPNHSLHILMPRTKEALKYFRRYSKFYLQGEEEGSPQVCWRVEATDWISTPGILEITAVEYYANEFEDDLEEGIAGGLVVKPPVDPNPPPEPVEPIIEGDTFIKPKIKYSYVFTGEAISGASWSIVGTNCPARLYLDPDNPLQIQICWEAIYSGQFTIKYGEYEKVIVAQSLY